MPTELDHQNKDVNPLVLQRATTNPYLHAASIVLDRFKWDLDPCAWRSRSRLRNVKDTHKGKKAVIVCNGPSLLNIDLKQLGGVFTFGLNKINLLFDKTEWRPNCIVAINQYVLEQNSDFFNQTELPLFVNRTARNIIQFRDNVIFLHLAAQNKLARDVSISMSAGATVTTAALQIAFHMGFSDVALVGCDHNFTQKGAANRAVTASGNDPSHFDPRYFSGGVTWQLPDLTASEYYYDLAANMFAAFDRRIVNCTIGGKLEVFQRMELTSWLQSSI